MNSNYPALLVMLIGAALLAGIMVLMSMPFGPFKRTCAKQEPFECGMKPIGPNRARFSARYYTLAILLLVFDIETAFLMPWAVLVRDLGSAGFVDVLIFIAVIGAGFVYLWRSGALDIKEA